MKTLVVARYKENIDWLAQVPKEWERVVIDKSLDEERNYPGREAHSYLDFIVCLYWGMIPDETFVFAQAHPFDHDPYFIAHLADDNVKTYGDIYVCNSDGGEHMTGAMLDELCERIGIKPPQVYRFPAGAQFRVTAEQIKRHPIEVYEFLLAYTKLPSVRADGRTSAHVLERMWIHLFDIKP